MTTDAEHGRDLAKISDAERLARAVLLVYAGGLWSSHEQALWAALTGGREATTKALGDLARRVRDQEEQRSP